MVKKHSGSENIRVVVRCRDLLGYEAQRGDKALVRMDLATNQVVVQHLIGDPDVFAFDAVYNNTFTQRDIFLQEVQPLADAVLQGYNATVFAYGQSGSGKTHTMTGNLDSRETYGMMPQVVDYLFSEIKKMTSATKNFKVKVSYVELYNGKSRDLLTRKQVNLEIKQNMAKNFYVKGAEMPEVTTFEEAMKQFNDGTERRKTASTDLNDTSSRSHALFTVQIEQFDFENDPSSPIVMTSKINVVDLAGSEKLSKTNATGDTAKEGCNINLSLSALATVIDTIVKGAKHIPYRGSPLTMLLKDSLGGNAKTVMFANVGPSDKNISETISTLRFALRAKQIENKPLKNMDPKDARIQDLMDQIEELKKRLGNVDLNVEDDLRQRIEELEIENSDLRAGGAEKNNVELEEQCRVLQSQLEQKEKAVHEAYAEAKREQESRAVMESKYNFESSHMKDLKTMTINFIKRICTEEQLAQIKAQMPKDGSYNLKDDAWDVKEILFYLQGFAELYEHWRKNTYTKDDLEKYATRAMADMQEQAQRQLLEATRAKDELTRQLGDETKRRTADTEASSQLKVDLAALRDENAKLREKIERDQEKIKAKLAKTKEEQKALQDQLEATKAQLTEKDRDIARLKKMIEEGAGSGAGAGAAAMLGTAGDSANGNNNTQLTHQLERERRAREVLENRIKQTNVSLRRFGVCITDASAVDGSGGGAAESTLQAEAQAFVLAAADEKDIDGDIYGQLQQQVRTKQRLTELYHQQQMRLDDMIRKYECLKTGKPTPNFASASAAAGAPGTNDGTGPISTAPILQGGAAATAGGLDEATAQQVRDLLQSKEDELEKLQREKDAACDKLVKKLNKSDRRIKDLETQLDDERAQFADERGDITKELAELRGYNQQLALEVETARTQLTNAKEQYESVVLGKDKEIDYLKDQVNDLNNRIAETRNKTAELEETNRSYMRLQQQLQRAEATMAEMSENLENNRQMLKQSTHLLELEKTKNDELDQQVRNQELEMRRQDEAWRQEVAEQVNLTVMANNRRLEQQNQQFQQQLADEQAKQKQLQKKLKSAKSNTQKAAQRYDEMILENESILSKLEELKVTSMKMYLEKQEAQRDLDAFRPTTNVRARAL